jgi:hypothetical protein
MNSIRAKFLLTLANLREILIAIDQLGNVLLCTLTMEQSWSDETLSAHTWRMYRDGKPWGRIFMPPIDWMFSWQSQEEVFLDENGQPITGHCRRAYMKERARDYLPVEYRDTKGQP